MSHRYTPVRITIEVPAYVAEALGTLEVDPTHAVGQTPAEKAARALVFDAGAALSLVQAAEVDGPAAVRILRRLEAAGLRIRPQPWAS